MAIAPQALVNAQVSAALSILPSFSDIEKDDKLTSTQWLQQFLNNKEGAGWTDAQTVTHFRNALKGSVVEWFNTLDQFDVDTENKNWAQIRAAFESNYKAKDTNTSIVSKLQKLKQEESQNC